MQQLSSRSESTLSGEAAGTISLSLSRLETRLERIETAMEQLLSRQAIKEYYSTAETAEILGRAEFTVREWCRLGRVHAEKRPCGRGLAQEWIVSHEELQRIRSHGLLPQSR